MTRFAIIDPESVDSVDFPNPNPLRSSPSLQRSNQEASQKQKARNRFAALPGYERACAILGKIKNCLVGSHERTPFQDKVRGVVVSQSFDLAIGLVVMGNAVSIAVESEKVESGSTADDDNIFRQLDFTFLVIFSVELALKLFVWRLHYFKLFSNMLDAAIVAVGWLTEVFLPLFIQTDESVSSKVQTVETVKVMRVLRCVRIVRMLTMFEELWLIVQSFFLSLKPLVWTCVFIIIIIFIFGNFAAQLIGQSEDFEDVPRARQFRTVLPSMMALFQIMTLDEWYLMCAPLFEAQAWTYVFFLVYIGVASLALMNLVTAVVVETSVRRTQNDQEYKQQIFESDVHQDCLKIREFVRGIDRDKAGVITRRQFLKAGVRSKIVVHVTRMLQMRPEEMFDIIDEDARGEVSTHELMHAVKKMEQVANSREMLSMIIAQEDVQDRMRHLLWALGQLPESMGERVLLMAGGIWETLERVLAVQGHAAPLIEAREMLEARISRLEKTASVLLDRGKGESPQASAPSRQRGSSRRPDDGTDSVAFQKRGSVTEGLAPKENVVGGFSVSAFQVSKSFWSEHSGKKQPSDAVGQRSQQSQGPGVGEESNQTWRGTIQVEESANDALQPLSTDTLVSLVHLPSRTVSSLQVTSSRDSPRERHSSREHLSPQDRSQAPKPKRDPSAAATAAFQGSVSGSGSAGSSRRPKSPRGGEKQEGQNRTDNSPQRPLSPREGASPTGVTALKLAPATEASLVSHIASTLKSSEASSWLRDELQKLQEEASAAARGLEALKGDAKALAHELVEQQQSLGDLPAEIKGIKKDVSKVLELLGAAEGREIPGV